MKRIFGTLVFGLCLGFGVNAEAMDDWVKAKSNVKLSDLTIGDLKALAEIQSVAHQEKWYVSSAGMSSFLLPGLGQFKTGDAVGGSLQMAGHVAIVGATLYGAWSLLPSDLQNVGLSHSKRHDLMKSYWENDRAKIAPAVGVMAGGAVLSLAYSFWSASDAKAQARENLESGSVKFEPAVFDGHYGFRARM